MDNILQSTPILLSVLGLVLVVLIFVLRRSQKGGDAEEPKMCSNGGGCCGGVNCHRHQSEDLPVTYYDDEELDRLQGKVADTYTAAEIQELTDVYETLLPRDRKGWLESLNRRGIQIPAQLEARISRDLSER